METLSKIANLQKALDPTATLPQASAWWELCNSIAVDIELDDRATTYERESIQRMKAGVSFAIAAIREGHPHIELGPARRALTGLQASIERRTTHGGPLRT